MVELLVALAIVVLITGIFIGPIFDRIQEAKADASIGKAQSIVRVCEIARRKVVSTTFVDRVASYSYGSLSAWSPVSSLQALLETDYKLPANNSFGLPFLVRFDEARCYVAVDLPFIEPGFRGLETLTVGANTRLSITIPRHNSSKSGWVSNQKRFLHLESNR